MVEARICSPRLLENGDYEFVKACRETIELDVDPSDSIEMLKSKTTMSQYSMSGLPISDDNFVGVQEPKSDKS